MFSSLGCRFEIKKEKGRIGRVEPLVENSIRNYKEEDEENLDENASRMLSSRSNPNGTGFSSNGKGSTP